MSPVSSTSVSSTPMYSSVVLRTGDVSPRPHEPQAASEALPPLVPTGHQRIVGADRTALYETLGACGSQRELVLSTPTGKDGQP